MRNTAARGRLGFVGLANAILFAACGGGDASSSAPSTPTSTATSPAATYMYVKGTDGLWGFRLGAAGELQPLPSSPMGIPEVPSFHPQGQYAVTTSGLQIALYAVEADGSIPSSPIQTIDTGPLLRATPTARPLNPGVWNPQGTVVGFTGADDLTGVYTGSALFFSFANGRLASIPGSPLTAGDYPAYLLFSQDGLAYAFQWGAFREPNVSAYRVSPTQATLISSTLVREAAYGPPAFLDAERFILAADVVWARQGDGSVLDAGGSSRIVFPGPQSYQLQSIYTRALDQRLAMFQSYRTGRDGRFNVLFAESIDSNGRLGASGADAILDLTYEWVVTTARGGRVILTKSNAQGIRVWPLDASGNFGAPRATGIAIFGDPRGASDPTGQFVYLMWREADGIPSLRVAADGQATRFDPLPAGVRFRVADARNRIVFNIR